MINPVKLLARLARQKRKGVKAVRYSPILALRYERNLISLVKELEKAAIEYIDGLKKKGYVTDSAQFPKFDLENQMKNLDKWAEETSKKFATGAEEFHRKTWRNELNQKTGIDLKQIMKTETVKPVMEKAIKDNVDLIKSIPKEYHDKIIEAIDKGMIDGDDSFTLKKAVKEIGEVTESRATLIARDQTSKMLSDLNEVRQKEIGITGYIWSTAGDSRVRPSHAANEGKKFKWDNPPEETGNPGDDVQCRCVADPDLSDLLTTIGMNEE